MTTTTEEMSSHSSWRHPLRGVRTRLVAYSVLLLAIGIAVTVFTARQIVLVILDSRIEESLVQEVREFRSLSGGVDPRTGRPFGPRLEPLFDLFLERNVPAEGEQLLTFRRGSFYRDRNYLESDFRLSSRQDLIRRWSALRRPESGDLETPAGPVRYLAVPVVTDGGPRGGFVVASFTSDPRQEVEQAMLIAAGVGAVVLLIGSIAAFLVAGRVLAPLRQLTETARRIGDSTLTQRIEVVGDDELAELGRTFNAMLDRIEEAFSSQRALLRDVSHELRTPITIARGHLELITDDPIERAETIELVTAELDRMGRLVEDLLTLARSERPDFLRAEQVRLGEFISEVLAKASSLGLRRWTLNVANDGTIVADPQRLTQALVNLAENAVKQTAEGDRIEIGAEMDGAGASLWVVDDGPGLDVAQADELFERFTRGSSGRRYAGTGLGLAIVRAIAVAHGGDVGVESEPGRGARFVIRIPRTPDPEAPSPNAGVWAR